MSWWDITDVETNSDILIGIYARSGKISGKFLCGVVAPCRGFARALSRANCFAHHFSGRAAMYRAARSLCKSARCPFFGEFRPRCGSRVASRRGVSPRPLNPLCRSLARARFSLSRDAELPRPGTCAISCTSVCRRDGKWAPRIYFRSPVT